MLQKLHPQQHHVSDMQEEPIDFSLTAFKKRKQPWHFPSKSQSPSLKRDSFTVSSTAAGAAAGSSIPSKLLPLDPGQRTYNSFDGQSEDISLDDRKETLRVSDANRNDTNRETWVSPAPSLKITKEIFIGKVSRLRKGNLKKNADKERSGSVASTEALPVEVSPIKRSVNTLGFASNRHTASASTVYKTSNGVSFVSQPSEEYEKIESCETRGLKLTFRRRSTEKSQQIVKDKTLNPQQDIPKLIVAKCKKAQGYSLHNGKNEKACKCSANVAMEDLPPEMGILSLPVSPKIITDHHKPLLIGETAHTTGETVAENPESSIPMKDTTADKKIVPASRRADDRDELEELRQFTDTDDMQNCDNNRNEGVIQDAKSALLTSKQVGMKWSDNGDCNTQLVNLSSDHYNDPSDCPVTIKKTISIFKETLDNTSSYQISSHLPQNDDNKDSEKLLISEQTVGPQQEHTIGTQREKPDSSFVSKSPSREQDISIYTNDTKEKEQITEQEETPNTCDTTTASEANTNNTVNLSGRFKLYKSESEGWYLPLVDADAIKYSRRSESAPPIASSLASSELNTSSISRETSRSKSLEVASSKLATRQIHCKRNICSSLDKPDRPGSSASGCSGDFKAHENHGRKSPVVLLDRLPSPVIELYSMRSSNHSYSDQSDCLTDDQVSSGEWSAYSEYDSENNAKSSGKLRFTYRKVNRGRGHKMKNKFTNGEHSRPSCSRYRGFAEKGEEECVMKNKGKKRSQLLQRRRQYGRASKRPVRYVNDDDEYREGTIYRGNDECMLGTDDSAEKSGHFQEKKLNTTTNSMKCGHIFGSRVTAQNMNVVSDPKEDRFIDPRIKSMSSALLNACENNQNAEKIAFRGKITPRSLAGKEPLKQRKNYSSQILKKASRAVDNIRKHFSKSTYASIPTEKPRGKQSSEDGARARPGLNAEKGRMLGSLGDIGHRSNLSGNAPYSRHAMGVPKRCSDNIQVVETAISQNRYRNVFESDVFQLPTNGSNESCFKFQSKSTRTSRNSEKNGKQIALKKWATRRPRGGKSIRALSRDGPYESGLKARCCKCRCRCQNNDDKVMRRKLLQKKIDIPESLRDSCSSEETATKESLHPCEMDVRIKHECPETEPESRESAGISKTTIVKREITSPTAPFDQDNNINGNPDELTIRPLAQVKTEITKDTDLMGLDYSQPKGSRLCSQSLDDPKDENDRSTRRDRPTAVASALEDREHSKMWDDTCCNDSQSENVAKDMNTSFLSEQTVSCSSKIHNKYPESVAPDIINQSCVSGSERPINFSSKPCDGQGYQISSANTSAPTPLYLFTNQGISRTPCSAFPMPNLPNCSLSSAYLPTLTLNTPLSIQIGHSPGNSEYGSPPNLSQYPSPGYGPHGVCGRSNSLQMLNNFYQSNQMNHAVPYSKMVFPQGQLKNTPCDLAVGENSQKKSSKHNNHSSKLSMSVPRNTISSPSSLCSKDQVTPSTASPTGATRSFFISPDLPRQAQVKSISRSSSPFRSPSTLLSPYRSPTTTTTTTTTADFHHKSTPNYRHTSDAGSSRMKPHTVYSSSNQRNYQSLQLPRIGNRHASNAEGDESDDSDATLAYPTADPDNKKMHSKARISSRRSSVGLSSTCYSEGSWHSALNSPSLKDEDRTSGAVSPSDNLELKRSELSSIVSDLRENISKTKAMKRNRRTNSFSGENKQDISDPNIASKTSGKRASFERFMSVEPLMDSDTPYARLTQNLGSLHEEDNKNFDMLRFVSGLRLQPKSREFPEPNLVPDGTVEGHVYYPKYEQSECSATSEQSQNIPDKHKCSLAQEDRPESLQMTTSLVSELQTAFKLEISSDDYNINKTNDNNDNKPIDEEDGDDDNLERPLVVIENAESDEVIEGDEAYHKMTSGTYNLPTGTVNQSEARTLKTKSSFKGKRLRISIKSLFTRKSPTKSKSFAKSTKEVCCKHTEKSRGTGYKFKRKTGRSICRVHQKRVQKRKKRDASADSPHDAADEVCDCKQSEGAGMYCMLVNTVNVVVVVVVVIAVVVLAAAVVVAVMNH